MYKSVNVMQKCPQCHSQNYRKNGRVRGKQRYLCKDCGRQFLEAEMVMESSPQSLVEKVEEGISIILLDLENIKLDSLAEDYLQQLASYPLQVKLAFANWSEKAVIKQDIEFYERGYFLVHVPGGKNSADARMMTLGAAIQVHYPTAKEVFVCSSDWLLTNLSNELLGQNLKVWRVRRQDKLLEIENRKSGEIYAYSLDLNQEIPDSQQLLRKLEALIAEEHRSISDKIEELSRLEALLTTRKTLLEKANSNGHVVSNDSDSVSTPSDSQLEIKAIIPKKKLIQSKADITGTEDLETAIEEVVKSLKLHSPHKTVNASTISNAFKKRFHITANQIIKELKIGGNITDFLQKRPYLLEVLPPTQETQPPPKDNGMKPSEITSYKQITTREQLRTILLDLVQTFIHKSGKDAIPLTTLGGDFKEYYGESVSTVMKTLNVTGKFTNFINSCEEFKLKKSGKTYHISLVNDR